MLLIPWITRWITNDFKEDGKNRTLTFRIRIQQMKFLGDIMRGVCLTNLILKRHIEGKLHRGENATYLKILCKWIKEQSGRDGENINVSLSYTLENRRQPLSSTSRRSRTQWERCCGLPVVIRLGKHYPRYTCTQTLWDVHVRRLLLYVTSGLELLSFHSYPSNLALQHSWWQHHKMRTSSIAGMFLKTWRGRDRVVKRKKKKRSENEMHMLCKWDGFLVWRVNGVCEYDTRWSSVAFRLSRKEFQESRVTEDARLILLPYCRPE